MGLGLRSLSKRERSWVLYDVGNSAYVMLAATLIPIYFSAIAEPGSSAVVAWGYATTVASLALALLMPFLGSLADLKGNKKKFLAGTIGTGAVSLAVMGVPGNAMVFLAIYVFSSVMLNASLVFYDAFLVDATEQDRYDEVSSQGYAWGYIGSCIPFIVCLVIVLFGSGFGIGQLDGIRISFVITAAWWLVFSVPVLRDVHQTHFKAREEHLFRHTLKGLVGTCKKIARDKRLLMYMLAFFFYIDGVHTIITMSTSYGTDLGIDSTQLVLALLVTQFVAFPSAIAYGRLAGRFGTKRMLLIAVFAYFCITLFRVLPALRRRVLGAGRMRRLVPRRHPGAVAQRVRQAHPEGERQRVLRLLRHLRQVRHHHGHAAGKRVHPAHGLEQLRRPQRGRTVHRRLHPALEDAGRGRPLASGERGAGAWGEGVARACRRLLLGRRIRRPPGCFASCVAPLAARHAASLPALHSSPPALRSSPSCLALPPPASSSSSPRVLIWRLRFFRI